MTREETIKWLESLKSEIGKSEHRALWHYAEAIDTAIESLSNDAVPKLRQTDTLIIADALEYLALDTERHLSDRTRADALRQQFLKYGASMCHSADAVPIQEVKLKDGFKIDDIPQDYKPKILGNVEVVVLCKDCRHRDLFSCPLADNNFQKDEDFCSWGERKEE